MVALVDTEFWTRWGGIVLADLLLAGDNALVIAMAVRQLPARERRLGRIYGAALAVVLRVVFVVGVGWLLTVPLLECVGGLLLLWVAWKLLAVPNPGVATEVVPGAEPASPVRAASDLRQAVVLIVLADVSMSLDNVLAIAGMAADDLRLVVAGIAFTVPCVVFGSALLSMLLRRLPWVLWLGSGVLGYVAGTLITADAEVRAWCGLVTDPHRQPLALALGVGFFALGAWRGYPRRRD